MKQVSWMIRWCIALVLAIAAGLKIGNHGSAETFFSALPHTLQWAVIAAELLLAAWLVSGTSARPAAFAAVLLFSAFLAAILINLGAPAPKSCGCLGNLPVADVATSLQISLGLDVLLLGCSLALYYLPAPRQAA